MAIKYKVLDKDGKQIARAWAETDNIKLDDFSNGVSLWYARESGWTEETKVIKEESVVSKVVKPKNTVFSRFNSERTKS